MSIIKLKNGARVVACDVFEEVRNDRDSSQYDVIGTVLADTGDGNFVTWRVLKRPDEDAFEAFWGKYFERNRLAATKSYEDRCEEHRSNGRPYRIGLGDAMPAFREH